MFTTFDKALVAVVMGLLSIGSIVFGWDFGIDEKVVGGIIAALTPILVYLWPNKFSR